MSVEKIQCPKCEMEFHGYKEIPEHYCFNERKKIHYNNILNVPSCNQKGKVILTGNGSDVDCEKCLKIMGVI